MCPSSLLIPPPDPAAESEWTSSTLPLALSFLSQTARRLELLRSSLDVPPSPPPPHSHQHKMSVVAALFSELDALSSLFKRAAASSKRPSLAVRSASLADLASGGTKRRRREKLKRLLVGDDDRRLCEEGMELAGEEREEVEAMGEFLRPKRVPEVAAAPPPSTLPSRPPPSESTAASSISTTIPDEAPDEDPDEDPDSAFNQSLALEGSILVATMHSSLDAAEEIESKMSSITALLSSFAALVQEQSETVREIGELAGQARGEVEKGGDELVTAKKRMDGSQMWIPMFNLFMAFLLLFMHWINP
ncbi:hypothetical protein TeGR_g1792 [Tetraparma gracilis]|uniref:t-SNARE coiled-coil homology domain-containing protein n=1 Tax=Tetraparma gracilis TaxID=2962635 RepID=A0ABQ6MV10_9STRA|nr:hypothetical protein TeGR_g1792 [Tetraparma gracilis]